PRTGPAQLDQIVLLTSEADVKRLLGAEPLSRFALAIEAAVVETAAAVKPGAASELLVDAKIEPGGRKAFVVAATPPQKLGACAAKASRCARPNSSQREMSVTNMRVRTTSASEASSSASAREMISKHRRACAYPSPSSAPTAAVPVT